MKDNAPGAMDALSKLGAAVIPAMRTMLSDANLEYRKDALSVLGGMGAAAAPAVPDIVQKMADKDLSTSAISALGNIGPAAASAVPDIVKAMAEKDLRSSATSALEKMGPAAAPAVPALINVLYDEDNRYNAELALAAIGPAAKDAVPYLIDVLQGKPQFTVQPPPAGSTYTYGEKLGEIGRIGMNVFSQDGAKDALTKIGTPEALAAVKQYDATQKK
jgi:HEAT repeat protein